MDVYHHIPHGEKTQKPKNFRLTDYDCLGWDLDHTLIRYNLRNLYDLLYESFVRYLVEKANYPAALKTHKLNHQFNKKRNGYRQKPWKPFKSRCLFQNRPCLSRISSTHQ